MRAGGVVLRPLLFFGHLVHGERASTLSAGRGAHRPETAVTAGKSVLAMPTNVCPCNCGVRRPRKQPPTGMDHAAQRGAGGPFRTSRQSRMAGFRKARGIQRQEGAAGSTRTCARFSTTNRLTRSPSPRRTIGMLCRPSGRARRARTYMSRTCTHNIFEAKQIVAAARKYDRIVQQGSQKQVVDGHCRKAYSRCARASSATSTWPAGCATRHATPSDARRFRTCPRAVDYDL